MDSIVSNLMKQITTGNNLSTIAKSVGGDEKGVQSALGTALPLLMGSMANSASKPEGANMLTNMLTQAGAKNPMDNLGSFLGNPEAAGGSGMVNMLLGNQTSAIQNSISQKSGLTSSAVGKLLALVAPMLMGSVGKMFTEQKMDVKGLSSLLGEQSKMEMQASPDVANLAKQFLGGTTEKSSEIIGKTTEKSSGILDKLKKLFSG